MTLIEQLNLYKTESLQTIENFDFNSLEPLCQAILDAYDSDSTVYFCGNGGNASTCDHWATDLSLHPIMSEDKDSNSSHRPIKAVSLCQSPSLLTAITNDLGPQFVYAQQIDMYGKEGDILIGLSGSGTSSNIITALDTAEMIGMKRFLITKNQDKYSCHNPIRIKCESVFPGQTGKNEGNFYYEDTISKIVHITTGLLKEKLWNL